MLGAIAALAIGSLFAATPAQAGQIGPPIVRGLAPNEVTCKEYSSAGGTDPYFPSSFWDCTDTANLPTSGENQVGSLARELPIPIKTALGDVAVMIFYGCVRVCNLHWSDSASVEVYGLDRAYCAARLR